MRQKKPTSVDELFEKMNEKNVAFIRLLFTDILGMLKSISVSRREIEKILTHGQAIDGSSIEGFARIEESDLVIKPDIHTFKVFPWQINGDTVGSMFCDVGTPDGKPYEGDPRYILKQMVERATSEGYIPKVGPEIEYFYFKDGASTELIDHNGYFDASTVDQGTRARKRAVTALEQMGVKVESLHHEVGHSQHEIDPHYHRPIKMADQVMTARFIIKETAIQEQIYATFMPKPIPDQNGSGMHVHLSLSQEAHGSQRNIFYDPKGACSLSPIAYQCIGGLLRHSKAMCLVTNQWVNSYKRIIPGFEAPVYISYGTWNRSSLIRIPICKNPQSARIELRNPDPACNPYLVFAVMLAAALDGIKNPQPLPPPVEDDVYTMTEARREELNIDSLPANLNEAIEHFQSDPLMKQTLGEHAFKSLIANKRIEWDNFRRAITDYELKNYLPIL
ncbi:MAG: type I glutamate--ammonia ligase [Patescibacteria group bacterium]|nr:type I glutamate--ammonia ligase [Patescibacteria group bacterium]MDD5715696.1 type I glutamate--ammonia ligase [Patescibacteria group bacterium]